MPSETSTYTVLFPTGNGTTNVAVFDVAQPDTLVVVTDWSAIVLPFKYSVGVCTVPFGSHAVTVSVDGVVMT